MRIDEKQYQETKLIAMLKNGSEYAFQLIYDHYRNRIYKLSMFGQLPYAGASKFTGLIIPVMFKQENWGRDERYKFKATVKFQDGSAGVIYYNSSNRDNQRATSSSPESYYYLWDNGDNSCWDYTFKFATEVDGKNIDVTADFSPSIINYTHKIIIK